MKPLHLVLPFIEAYTPVSDCSSLIVPQDLEIVYSYLHGMEALSNLREHQLR